MSLPRPYYEEPGITIYHGDCRDILPHLEPVDLVLTDPPYGAIGGSKAIGGNGFVRANEYDLSWDFKPVSKKLIDQMISISTNQVIFRVNYFWNYFLPSNSLIIWDKKCQNGWQDTFSDGEIAWTSYSKKLTIFRFLWVGALKAGDNGKRIHPTQKPEELMRWILGIYITEPFETILDPFMGSGTTLRAAKDLGRKAIGIEIEEKYCEIAVKRLQQEVFDFK